MSDSNVRVRFAPSPTGPLHIGGVRTALYNYLFAKKHNGTFILRIEDTDQTRYVPGAEDYILNALKWSGITPDEGQGVGGEYGPYRQSERKPMYRQYAEQLVKSEHAYYAFDTSEELTAMRERLEAAKVAAPQYNAVTRSSMKNSLTLSADEVQALLDADTPYVIRIKIPRNEEVRFHDEVRGWVVVHSANMDDKVLFKSDGMPTYHLANVVDDYLMKITHVIRGEEWLPSAPLHVLLYRSFGWEDVMPKFAHLSLILKPNGNGKLSKRDGDQGGFPVFPLEWTDPNTGGVSSGYRESGYFQAAFVNMLAFLGWNPGTAQELFSLEELVEAFSLERVGKSGAKFDPEKAKWFNQQYLRMQPNSALGMQLAPLLKEQGIEADWAKLEAVCELMSERAVFVADMVEGAYLLQAPTSYDEKSVKQKWKDKTPELMRGLMDVFKAQEDFSADALEAAFKNYLEVNELGMGAVLGPFRVLITGQGMGPSMFAVANLLGKEETLERMENGLQKLG